jgi:hypothetical protein
MPGNMIVNLRRRRDRRARRNRARPTRLDGCHLKHRTRRSRWYVTSAFTTFLVFLLLLYSDTWTPELGSLSAWSRR